MSDQRYILYGDVRSGACIVEATLAELGADYVVRNVDLSAAAQRGADYARVNPQRKLPSLITPAGETLTESAAIVLT
ncbi:MAG: glutathione S-transferase family protein, partial [Gammaproteobacteria bacterium]|nr:glutathione S-transferase family protein [Gammaproteobacteria bacterium]